MNWTKVTHPDQSSQEVAMCTNHVISLVDCESPLNLSFKLFVDVRLNEENRARLEMFEKAVKDLVEEHFAEDQQNDPAIDVMSNMLALIAKKAPGAVKTDLPDSAPQPPKRGGLKGFDDVN